MNAAPCAKDNALVTRRLRPERLVVVYDPVLALLPAAQRRVHQMIMSVGGYWSPSAGVLRLLEELGELAELWEEPSRKLANVAEELADLWIITTCTANQFLIDLSASGDMRLKGGRTPKPSGLEDLVYESGRIARLINYYDGPKRPRHADDWPSLGKCITKFHGHLESIANWLQIDLSQQVDEKLAIAKARDSARFRQSEDASTADACRLFASTVRSSRCAFAKKARIWGAPLWEPGLSTEQNVGRMVPTLSVFCKAAREGLDGYVVANLEKGFQQTAQLADWFRQLLCSLAEQDPYPSDVFTDGRIDRPGWQFCFHDVRLFVTLFSALYPSTHPRHSDRGTYVLFQPEESFTHHRIGSQFPDARVKKEAIRRRFASAGMYYPGELIDRRIEALLYILPMSQDDPPIQWWKPLQAARR